MTVIWQWKAFAELDTRSLYQVLQLRQDVFVLEQQCLYSDIDNLDSVSYHLLGFNPLGSSQERKLIAYLRVVAPAKKYPEPSIGRVVTSLDWRRKGLGKQLLQKGLTKAKLQFPNENIRISAQRYLSDFYRGFGFQAVGQPYLEDGIPHIEMLLCCNDWVFANSPSKE